MNWHTRFSQQANWTRALRNYIFEKVGLKDAQRVLEVGCGTGAILSELSKQVNVYGLDLNPTALTECRVHAPSASLVQGDALQLPYLNKSFDIVYSHFLLLWVRDPLRALLEMKRVTRAGGYIIAFAEPDYFQRIDQPDELIPLGKWQTEALIRQGANPGIGAQLAELFFKAGITIIETGPIQSQEREPSDEEWEIEWDVIESDLTGWIANSDIQRMKHIDKETRQQKRRVLKVPTYFAWGRV
jgi:ubiquinone/menaquinone biosynthesis C-methylase UbiE